MLGKVVVSFLPESAKWQQKLIDRRKFSKLLIKPVKGIVESARKVFLYHKYLIACDLYGIKYISI